MTLNKLVDLVHVFRALNVSSPQRAARLDRGVGEETDIDLLITGPVSWAAGGVFKATASIAMSLGDDAIRNTAPLMAWPMAL